MLESFRLDVPKLDFKELCHDIGSLFAPNKIVLRMKETGKNCLLGFNTSFKVVGRI